MNGAASDGAAIRRARAIIEPLFAAALKAVDPARAVRDALAIREDTLVVGDDTVRASRGIHIAAVGKAGVAMTRGALEALGERIVSGHVITKEGHLTEPLPEWIRVFEAGHPIPNERGVRATERLLTALGELGEGEVVLALISGGGSALLEAPRPGLTLDDLARTTDALLRAGAPIEALNAVRAPLSRVKAGGLRAAAPLASWVTLILSDVLGNDPRVIASGPTVPSRHDPAHALEIIDRYGVRSSLPGSVLAQLESESGKANISDVRSDLLRVIGDNAAAIAAAAHEARALGLESEIVWRDGQGEASDLGREFVAHIEATGKSTDVALGGGEATVTVRGEGRGGRNTEFALAAALELERRRLREWVVASLATDGQDALTGVAGAIADAATCERARERGVNPEVALAGNDSMAVFEAAGGLLETGPTGTNVNDLYMAVRARTASHRSGGAGGE